MAFDLTPAGVGCASVEGDGELGESKFFQKNLGESGGWFSVVLLGFFDGVAEKAGGFVWYFAGEIVVVRVVNVVFKCFQNNDEKYASFLKYIFGRTNLRWEWTDQKILEDYVLPDGPTTRGATTSWCVYRFG